MCIKGYLVFAAFLAVVSAAVGPQLLFPEEHRQYNYVIKANVSSGTLVPRTSATYWTLEGKLSVQVYDNFTKVRLQLSDLETSAFSKNHVYNTYQSSEAVRYLQEPWELDYKENGFIRGLYVSGEPVWATNIKRALSVNFQLRRETGTYTNEEPCLYAGCVVVYVSKGNLIKKYNNLQLSSVITEKIWSSVPVMYAQEFDIRGVSDTITTSEREYELDEKKGLVSLDLKSDFQYKTHNHILVVSSEFSLYHDTDLPAQGVEKLNLTQFDVQYMAHDFNDPSNSIRNRTQPYLKNKSYEILLKIAKKGIDSDTVSNVVNNLHFISLLNTMSQLSYDSLKKLFDDMVLGTSYDIETARNIFLEVLPHIRTNACALFVKHLVLEEKEKIEDATILSLIRKLPFNIANHSQSLLEELEVFTKLGLDYAQDIRYAGILSFATLIYKAKEARSVKGDYFDNIVVKYFRMYSDCPQYLDRLIWLQGLCNMGHSAESYTRTIYLDNTRDRHERLWAGLAGAQTITRPYMVLETTLPILMDDNEHIQLRICALHIFLSSDIRASDFIYVHNYIRNSNNNQLKRFWYTTVKSLENSKFYHAYRAASYFVPFISNQVSNPDSTYWATNNYIISSQEDAGAASLQVLSVGEALNALPAFAALKLSTGGRRPSHADIYIVAEGVTTNMYQKFHNINLEELQVERLLQVMRKMKVQFVQREKVHIDLVIKIHDKTVFAMHVNQSRFDSWNGEDLTKSIEDFLRFGSHINQQIVYYPFQMDINIPSELGTPIRLQSAVVSFTSIRGNLTAPSSHDLTWRNDLNVRYQGISVTSLSTDGPLLQTEHSARIQQSVAADIPMKFDVTLSPVARSFEIKWPNPGAQPGGIAMMSQAKLSLESLKGFDTYPVSSGENKYKLDKTALQFNCERPLSGAEALEKLVLSQANTLDLLSSLQPSRILLKGIILLTSPTSGSCGIILTPHQLMRPGDTVLELKLKMEDIKIDLDDQIRFQLDHSLTFRETNETGQIFLDVSGYTKVEAGGGNLTFELLLTGQQSDGDDPAKRKWKMCLQERDFSHTTSDQDISSQPAAYEGQLNLIYAVGDNSKSCPTSGSEFLVQYRGVPSDLHGSLERYFEIKMTGNKLLKLDFLQSSLIGRMALGPIVGDFEHQPLNVTAVVKEKNGIATLTINNASEAHFKSENFAWLLDSWSNMQIMKKFGIYRECRLQESTVKTLTGVTDRLPPVECSESLILADCTETPRFAVLRLKNGGIKVYTGGNYVTLERKGGGARVTINGDIECRDDCVFPKDEPIYDFRVTQRGDAVKVFSRLSGIQVYYRYLETVVLVPHSYMHTSCGSCVGQHYYQLCQL